MSTEESLGYWNMPQTFKLLVGLTASIFRAYKENNKIADFLDNMVIDIRSTACKGAYLSMLQMTFLKFPE